MKLTKHMLKQLIREQLEDELPEDERDEAQTSSEVMIDKAVSALIESTYDFDPPQEQLDELENKARDLLNDPELVSMLDAIEGAGSEFN